ncbi:MAG: coproporphyrinogen III oxidase, partial [Marinicellaceae bacterium]
IYRGYLLNEDDLIRKAVIQEIACQFALDFKSIEQKYTINFIQYFSSEISDLLEMQVDGLLKIHNERLTVTPEGRVLVRHICMVFDIYLRKQSEQRFSKVI